MIPQVHVFFNTTFTQVTKLELSCSTNNEPIPCHTQTRQGNDVSKDVYQRERVETGHCRNVSKTNKP